MDGFGNGDFGGGGFNLVFTLFPIFFILVFVIVFGGIIFGIISSAKRYHKNNISPVLIVDAKVVSKRTDVTHHHSNMNDDNISHHSSSTWYYVTFQVESGDRMEFHMNGEEYGILAEEDYGKLKFQGTRYLGFTRSI